MNGKGKGDIKKYLYLNRQGNQTIDFETVNIICRGTGTERFAQK
jgi:hypothetical protein